MKTWNDLNTALQKATTPEQVAGTFVDSTATIIESNKNDPVGLNAFVNNLRSSRQSLISALTDHKQR